MSKPEDFAIDELDQKMVKLLSKDGRITNRVLAEKLSVSEITVAARLRKLSERGIARVVGMLDLESAGYQMSVILNVHVTKGRADAVAKALAKIDEMIGVSITSGDCDIVAAVRATDPGHLRQVLETRVGKIKDIISFEPSLVIDLVGFRPEWATNLASRDE